MSESIVQNTCRAKVAPSKYEQTPFKTHLGPTLDPVHVSRQRSKYILGQSWARSADIVQKTSRANGEPQKISADTMQNTCRAQVGPSTCQQSSFKTFLGQSWTQYMSADMVWNILRAKVRLSKYQQASFKTHLGPKLNPVHVSRHPSKHIQGQSWTQ